MATEDEIKSELIDVLKNDPLLAAMATDWGDRHVFDNVRDLGRKGRVKGRLPFVEVMEGQSVGSTHDGTIGENEEVEFQVRCNASEATLHDLLAKVRNAIDAIGDGYGMEHQRVFQVALSVGETEGTRRWRKSSLSVRVSIVYQTGQK